MDIIFPTTKISSFPLKAERSSPSIFKPWIMSSEGRPFKDYISGYVKSVKNTVTTVGIIKIYPVIGKARFC